MERLSQYYTKIGLLRYVLPVVATMLIGSAYGAIDGLFVSNMVGKTALASIAIVAPFVMILFFVITIKPGKRYGWIMRKL